MAGILAAAALLLAAGPAFAQAFINVSPSSLAPGGSVTVSGNVGNGCQHGDQVTLISQAFGGPGEFAGVPAVNTTSNASGAFSATATIPSSRAPGSYSVSARCGGGSFGSATITVQSGTAGSTLPRTGWTPWLPAALGAAMLLAGTAGRRVLSRPA
jgi:hypothetical protein